MTDHDLGRRRVELRRETLGIRWCFNHRGRDEFIYTVTGDAEPSYYEPNPAIHCGHCGQVDGDIGFGGCGEWGWVA